MAIIDRIVLGISNVNHALLDEEIKAVVPEYTGHGGPRGSAVRLHFEDSVGTGGMDTAEAITLAHNPALFTDGQQAEQDAIAASANVVARFDASNFADKTPDEIFAFMQTAIDGWSTLSEAQADMRKWFPLMAALIIHLRSE